MKTRERTIKYTYMGVCVIHSFMHSFLQRHKSIRTVDRPLNDESFLDPHHLQRGVEIPTWLLLICLDAGWTLATNYAKCKYQVYIYIY